MRTLLGLGIGAGIGLLLLLPVIAVLNHRWSGTARTAVRSGAAVRAQTGAGPASHLPGFGPGTYRVPDEVRPGTYRSRGGAHCYWERLRGFGGTLSEIIANGGAEGRVVVTIEDGDAGFRSNAGCGTWTQDLSPVTAHPAAPFRDGIYIVGVDIEPGSWRTQGAERCTWARLRGFGGTVADIIARGDAPGPVTLTILPSDRGFMSAGCGTWTKAR